MTGHDTRSAARTVSPPAVLYQQRHLEAHCVFSPSDRSTVTEHVALAVLAVV